VSRRKRCTLFHLHHRTLRACTRQPPKLVTALLQVSGVEAALASAPPAEAHLAKRLQIRKISGRMGARFSVCFARQLCARFALTHSHYVCSLPSRRSWNPDALPKCCEQLKLDLSGTTPRQVGASVDVDDACIHRRFSDERRLIRLDVLKVGHVARNWPIHVDEHTVGCCKLHLDA
jgi:hypothetical protein